MAPESKASLSSVRLAWLCLVRVGVGGGLQQNSLGPESNYRRTTLQKSGGTHFLGPHQQTMAAPKVNPGRPGKEQPPGSRALQPGFQGTQQVPTVPEDTPISDLECASSSVHCEIRRLHGESHLGVRVEGAASQVPFQLLLSPSHGVCRAM